MPILDFSIDGFPYRSRPDVTLVILSAITFPNENDERRRLEWLRKAVNTRTSKQVLAFPTDAVLPSVPAVHHRVLEAAKGPRFDRDRDAPDFGIDVRAVSAVAFILVHTLVKRGSVIGAIRSYITGDGRRPQCLARVPRRSSGRGANIDQ